MDPLNTEFIRLLHKCGWSASEAARELDLNPATISRYLTGEIKPSKTVIQLFKLRVGDDAPLPGEELVLREAIPEPTRAIQTYEAELLHALRLLDEPTRQALISHFRGIAALLARRGVVLYSDRKKGA